ncbi:MAG: DNA cytosine methyltransferase [Clostridiales bacterium]|jgi:DNA (cytosine-5)-methyltransferase 1|nr:DNA cytosine methyltransferase [Clostridiales bacterium]
MINSIELFCGTGGLALGFHQAGFRHKALIEWDKDSCNNVKANIAKGFEGIADWNVVQADVRLVRYSDYGLDVHFVTGGPPCQPFSLGGKHKAHADARDMFPEAVRAVRELRPQGFVFENVKGLLRKSFSSYFNYILLQLSHPEIIASNDMDWAEHLRLLEECHTSNSRSGLNYNVVFRLVNAADYGVPQMRHRVVIVGFRADLSANWSFPEPTHSKEALFNAKYGDGSYWEEHGIPKKKRPAIAPAEYRAAFQTELPFAAKARWRTARDAIRGLPDPRDEMARSVENHEYRNGARPYAGHSGSVLDEPSKTIKAGAHGVPGGENMLVLDNGDLRYYTVRESARIQTFPDGYHFHGSWTESMRQIGNAVPVKLARIIGDSIARQFEGTGSLHAK